MNLRRLAVALLWGLPAALAQSQDADLAAGKAVFDKNWVTAPASTQASDGLGPYYEARSCNACHPGGHPGAVPGSLVLVLASDPVYGQELQQHAVAGLPAEGRLQITQTPADAKGLARFTYKVTDLAFGPLTRPGSLRRPPSLFGAAALDEVDDEVLAILADPDDKNGDGISGRLTGRHGWKGETASLTEQIAKALSLDIGLSTSVYPSPHGDCTLAQTACLQQPKGSADGQFEAPAQVVLLLADYLRSLAPPAPQGALDAEGQGLFVNFGCSSCHVPRLPTASQQLQAWSDLLLHDLGGGLAADNGATSGAEPPATAAEWRTPPLWGVGQRNRYLHDGRATSLDAAIRWHGGEADASRERYEQATKLQQDRLLAFLRGL